MVEAAAHELAQGGVRRVSVRFLATNPRSHEGARRGQVVQHDLQHVGGQEVQHPLRTPQKSSGEPCRLFTMRAETGTHGPPWSGMGTLCWRRLFTEWGLMWV